MKKLKKYVAKYSSGPTYGHEKKISDTQQQDILNTFAFGSIFWMLTAVAGLPQYVDSRGITMSCEARELKVTRAAKLAVVLAD